jgi:UDP-N-acetylglucosamine--N-acetylmuramyl-(pentapeptide) pyrophosphoryl-undecaprenol N-acetylglucosamine transferase
MRVLLAGGGTGGPVAPLLAVAQELKKIKPETEFLFVGSSNGPEREMVEGAGFIFIGMAGAKFRRYFSLKNFLDIFVFFGSLFKARSIISEFKPDVIFSVGGFISVPIAWVARFKKVKVLIHQQDARPGLANRLVSPQAAVITTAFEETAKLFHSNLGLFRNEKIKRVEWVGNPVRREFFEKDLSHKDFFQLHGDLPVLLIFGGASGAKQINEVVAKALPDLVKSHQVVHVTGRMDKDEKDKKAGFKDPNYHQYEFLGKEMPTIMKMSDIILCRAGLSSIAELSVLGKISIIVPMPDSHQEENAEILKRRSAAVILTKEEFTPETLSRVVTSLKFNIARRKLLSDNISKLMPKDAAKKLASIIMEVADAK